MQSLTDEASRMSLENMRSNTHVREEVGRFHRSYVQQQLQTFLHQLGYYDTLNSASFEEKLMAIHLLIVTVTA